MKNIYISVVSHNHLQLIESINCIQQLAKIDNVKIVIKTNTNEGKTRIFDNSNVFYIDSPSYIGFGHNNNIVYDYCKNNLKMSSRDYFIVLNPDVYIDIDNIKNLIDIMERKSIKIAAINLYKDEKYSIYDNSIRKFPSFMTFLNSFIGRGNNTLYDKNNITNITLVDWAAGSFLAFKSEHFNNLNGFDTKYFMYCEDIDICYRSMLEGEKVTYLPFIKAIHLAKHANRSVFSKHFYWHLLSSLRFLKVKNAK